MGRKAKWQGEDLRNLLTLPLEELKQKYPNIDYDKLRAERSYWKRKMEQEGKLYKTWETSAYDKKKQEWVTATNHGYIYEPDPETLAETFEPVEPAKITPTRRKRAERLGRQLLVFGDTQIGYRRVYDSEGNDELIPTHSEEVLSVLSQINAHERPDEIINLSDTIDLAELSRFAPDSDNYHRTLSPSFRRVHDMYSQLRADNPDARITEVDSNHTQRVHKAILKNMPALYGLTLPGENYPLLSYYRLANLESLGIDFISGYGAAEYVYGDDNPIVFKHGTHSSSTPGGTVRKEMSQNPEVNVVRGHGHSSEHVVRTNRDGDYLHYLQIGTTCATNGSVPSYGSAIDDFGRPVKSQENWVNQLLMVTDYEGQYQFDVIDVVRGIGFYRGNRYDGNQND